MPECPRNIFLMNTAVSGILLCVVAMPLTLIDLIHSFWVLGNTRVSRFCMQMVVNKNMRHNTANFLSISSTGPTFRADRFP